MTRKYESIWHTIKKNAQVSHYNNISGKGIIRIQVTTSTLHDVITKFAKTATRGVQKEKYLDTVFRRKYPNSYLNSSIDLTNGTVTLELYLADSISLDDL